MTRKILLGLLLVPVEGAAGPVTRPAPRSGFEVGRTPAAALPGNPEAATAPSGRNSLGLPSPLPNPGTDSAPAPELSLIASPAPLQFAEAPFAQAALEAAAVADPAALPAVEAPGDAVPGTLAGDAMVESANSPAPADFAPNATLAGVERLAQTLTASAPDALDAAFDLRRERSQAPADPVQTVDGALLLRRAADRGLPLARLGDALQRAPTQALARSALEDLGLLSPGEIAAPLDFVYALHRAWHEAAAHVPAQFEVDQSWAIPALVVRKEGVTYFIHGITHRGKVFIDFVVPGQRSVRRLLAQLMGAGAELYSEQGFPLEYGYAYGREIMDKNIKKGLAVYTRDLSADAPVIGLTAWTRFGLAWISTAAGIGLPTWLALQDPASPWAWGALGLAAALIALLWTAFVPLHRLGLLRRALALWLRGFSDRAHYAWTLARTLYNPSLAETRRRGLPMPLGHGSDIDSQRSTAQARAAAEDARARGLTEAHVLVGINHVFEAAWHLSK